MVGNNTDILLTNVIPTVFEIWCELPNCLTVYEWQYIRRDEDNREGTHTIVLGFEVKLIAAMFAHAAEWS